ncbi:MAG: gamma-glutamyltransferase family protein [Chloroflexota bacterium]|nr:gamma-glutamyltransferase family protein [Chloroflexota bacterium]
MATTISTVQTDLTRYPYPSQRTPVMAARGGVATSQPLAAQAGLSMLQNGGSAVDAALASAIALTVVEPTSNGIGGDAFALVWDGHTLHGLNGSGRAPARATVDALAAAGHKDVPALGWWPVTVPGAPRAWADLHARFGRLPFASLFAPAITYARLGFPVSPVIARLWAGGFNRYSQIDGPEFRPWFDTFAPTGRPPLAGERWSSPAHAATLERIADSGARDFYEGELAGRIAGFTAETSGLLTHDDLAAHTSTWVDPIAGHYRGYDVWEIPPNGQGIATLIGLQILDGLDLAAHPRESADAYHLQIEALKLSLTDARRYVADMGQADVPVRGLLDPAYAAERRALIGERALDPAPGSPARGGTVYLCAADADGMMVSYIQSNYQGFGSGVVVPGTGIALHNRGYGFVTAEGHPNRLAPGKRPFHTIIPGFLTRDGRVIGPFGVMGGFMQAQGHLQMMVNTLDYAMNPQASLDAPRWRWDGGRTVAIEPGVPDGVAAGLRALGHDIVREETTGGYGRGQIIWRLADGGYVAGSDPRADGCAVAN